MGAAGLASSDEVRIDHSLCRRQSVLGSDALRQAHLPVREGGLGLTGSAAIAVAVYISRQALSLGRVLNAASTRNLHALLEHLLERPLAKELIAILKEVADITTKVQLNDAVGPSRAALRFGRRYAGRGQMTCSQR